MACGLAVAAIGALVLLGWLIHFKPLIRIAPGLVEMKATTAIGMILAGVSLACLRRRASVREKVCGRALGLVVATIGTAVAFEYLVADLGIDHLFADPESVHPGRPSQHTAVSLVLFGLATATTDLGGRWRRLSPGLGVAFALVAIFAVVGYIYGVSYLHSGSGEVGIAVPTLLALVLLALGLLSLRPERGLFAILIGRDTGAQMARTWLPVAVIGPVLLGSIRFGAQEAGWIGLRVGLSAYTLAATIGLTALVAVTARRLRESDAQLQRLATIVDSSDDAIVSSDRRRRISSWNPGAERLLGYSEEEAVGRPVVDLVPPQRVEEFEQKIDQVTGGVAVRRWQTERLHKDGSLVAVELSVSPLIDERGRVQGASVILRDIRGRLEAERRFRSLLEAAPDPILIVDRRGDIVIVNEQAEDTFGYKREELIGKAIENLVPERLWRAHVEHRQGFLRKPAKRVMGAGIELTARRRDGSEFPAEISLSPLHSDEGLLVIAAVRDVTRRRRTESALAESEERFRRAFEDSGVAMALVAIENGELGGILEANEAFASLTGIATTEIEGMEPIPFVHAAELPLALEDLEQLLDGRRSFARREIRLLTADRKEVWASVTGSIVCGADGRPLYLVVQAQDVSERKHFENQLQYLADHDLITGLFNRRRLEEELERELATAARFGGGGAVLVLDLDHFKLVNDSLGHAAGDELIANVSQILRRRLRSSDVLGRMGGDEFAVVLPRVSAEQACEVGRSLLEDIRKNGQIPQTEGGGRVTASVGVASFGDEAGATAQDLLARADIAMYDAKEAGRDRITVFDPGSPRHERTRERVDWLERIEAALANDRFVLHAQPILALDGDRSERFELLLRMISEDGDLIPPAAFLGFAERSDLAQRIDRWVITHAVEMLAEQERRGRDVYFEINLSGGSIGDAELSDHIAETLRRSGIEPGRLIFEVTETAAIVNVSRAKEFAERMQEIGCGFALDDFGAGFASFYYLKHLSFDLLKIDGEFIRNLPASTTDQLVVRSVVDIAKGLGKRTIAEFVGDRATLDLLREYGVDFAQGFYLGLPRPLEDIEDVRSTSGSRR
ncbi:MAG: PAS domain S-box protein [Methanosarcina sp.]